MKNINSLKNTIQFKKVYSEGKSFANRYLVMYVLKDQSELCIGISVSKKIGNSVIRHRTTRLIREAFTAYKEGINKDCHIVVVARSGAKGAALGQIEESFKHLLDRHGIYELKK